MSEKTLGEVGRDAYNRIMDASLVCNDEELERMLVDAHQAAADAIAAPLLARIAELEQIKAAIDHIAKDRLGSFTACGRWTLTADLTPDEIQASYYRVAYQRGVAEERERCARIAMQAYTVYHDSDIPKAIADAIRKEPT